MDILSEYDAEKSRIEGEILAVINTSLGPAVAARKALGGAFPSAIFEEKEDGTLSVQGLDAAQRQSLEDALFELNLSLASQAVAKGLPLMQYLHPDATHDGITTLPRFLQVCLELARPLLSEPIKDAEKAGGRKRLIDFEGWARLFEGLMEVGTIADCADLFRLMEGGGGSWSSSGVGGGGAAAAAKRAGPDSNADLGWAAVFCSEDFRREQGAKLTLLRMSNMLFRRLSKAYDVRLCGRLLIFISRCYELNDKSGLNVAGALNTGLSLPIDEVELGAVDSIGEQIDRRLYTCFWGLQAIFQNPSQVLQPVVYGKVLADMSVVLEEFAAIKNPVAATGPWVASRSKSRQAQRQDAAAAAAGSGGGGDAMEVDGSIAEEGAAAGASTSASSLRDGADGSGGGGGGVGTRYLTSSKLFGLQVRDCTFRRHFLLQCLALLQYIEQPSKTDKSAIGQRPEGLEAIRTKLFAALSDTKESGPDFAAAVRSVLEHEAHWVAWKHGTQPPGSGVSATGGGVAAATGGGGAAAGAAGAAVGELCRDFTRPPAPPTREITSTSNGDAGAAVPPKRKRGAAGGRAGGGAAAGVGRFAVSRGVLGMSDPLAGLRVSERRTRARNLMGEEEIVPMLPTPTELLAPILEDLDPDNDVEAHYRRVREPVFAWKRMRTLARNCLEFYKKGDDVEESVLDMHPDMKAKIAARKAEREAELAAAAAAEAAEAGELLPGAGDAAANDPSKPEEGEAVASPRAK